MDIEIITTGIDESLLEFDEDPKDFKEESYDGRLYGIFIGLLALLIL